VKFRIHVEARIPLAVFLLLFSGLCLPAGATNLAGTFKHPDGSPVNGKLIFLLSQPARLNDNSAQIVPMVKIFSINNGVLESGAFVYGNDVLVPGGTYYLVRLVDNNNNLLFEQKWSITGASLDLGTLTPTTTSVVVPDPLLRNVTTNQIVQGPVTFNSGVTAFNLTLNGNLNPGTSNSYDLGSTAAPWRELFAQRWNGTIRPGTATGTVTPPSVGPSIALESASGGSIAAGTYYFCYTLVNLNGETPCSPEVSFNVASGSTNQLVIYAGTGNEWRTGAFAYRVYASSSAGGTKFLQTPRTLSVNVAAGDISRSTAGVVTVTTSTAHGLGGQWSVTVAGVTGCTTSPDGTFTVLEVPSNTTFTYAQSGTAETCGTGGTASWKSNVVLDSNTHFVPGEFIVSALSFSGTTPPVSNSATIDADQVAWNEVCPYSTGLCRGTLQYPSADHTGTTPLILGSLMGGRVSGHSGTGLDSVSHGSTRVCSFVQPLLGCVMIMYPYGGVSVEGLNIKATNTNGYVLYHSNPGGGLSTFSNDVRIAEANVETNGTAIVAPLRIYGRWFYLNFDRLQLTANTSTAGGAGVIMSHFGGGEWRFHGPVRWTIPGIHDWVRSEHGPDDPDRNTGTASAVTNVIFEHINFQCGPTAADTGEYFKLLNVGARIRDVNGSDCSPDAGVEALIQLGLDSHGASVSGLEYEFINSGFTADADAPSTVKILSNAGTIRRLRFVDTPIFGSASSIAFDFNNVATVPVYISGTNLQTCNPSATSHKIANRAATAFLDCNYITNSGVTENQRANRYFMGGLQLTSPGDHTLYWSGVLSAGTLDWYNDDPATGSNKRMSWGNKFSDRFILYQSDGAATLADFNASGNLITLYDTIPTASDRFLGNAGARWQGYFTTGNFTGQIISSLSTGTAPFGVASTTEVANLNAQNWHGKQAIDFSASLDFGSIAAQSCATLTITAAGAVTDSAVAPSWPAALEAGLVGIMHATASDTVTVRLCNVTAAAIDPASRTYAGRVIK
jgi:hypothetical protein